MILNFVVVRSFKAIKPISGREHWFEPGTVVECETSQTGPTISIEADMALFSVDRPTFDCCCKFENQGITSV
jgi:hypothetical protein